MAQLYANPQKIAEDHYLLKIKMTDVNAQPGQFINIKANDSFDPLLRRPFSICNQQDDILEVVVKIVGKGTERICAMQPGTIDILGPLGKGFTLLAGKKTLLIGGGVGNAPLLYLGKRLQELGSHVTFIYGARSAAFIYMEKEFSQIADTLHIITDDGSKGRKGWVTECAHDILTNATFDMVYTCGPTIMMNAVAKLAAGIPCEVSVENYFGCGIGLCVGCTVTTKDGFKRACIDGPVFSGDYIILNQE